MALSLFCNHHRDSVGCSESIRNAPKHTFNAINGVLLSQWCCSRKIDISKVDFTDNIYVLACYGTKPNLPPLPYILRESATDSSGLSNIARGFHSILTCVSIILAVETHKSKITNSQLQVYVVDIYKHFTAHAIAKLGYMSLHSIGEFLF